MLLAHAHTLVRARSHLAALADQAGTLEASSGYERALIELDWIHADDVPALNTDGLIEDRDLLMAVAVDAIEQLTGFGVDALHIELLLADLAAARALDVD